MSNIDNQIKTALEKVGLSSSNDNIKAVKDLMAKDSSLDYNGAVNAILNQQKSSDTPNLQDKIKEDFEISSNEVIDLGIKWAKSDAEVAYLVRNRFLPVFIAEKARQGYESKDPKPTEIDVYFDAKTRLQRLDEMNYDRRLLQYQAEQKQLTAGV